MKERELKKMIEGLLHYQVLNVVVNAWLAFLTTFFLIELFLKISPFQNIRMISLIRMIPIIKLPFDVWLADWSRWALLHGISPLECAEGSRMLFIGCSWIDALSTVAWIPIALRIGFELAGGYTFSLIDLLSPLINLGVVRAISYLFIVLTGLKFLNLGVKIWKQNIRKKEFLKGCSPCYRAIENLELKKALLLERTEIFINAGYAGSPLLIGIFQPKIIFPERLLQLLDQKEYEAILAHELQHAIHKDIFIRGMLKVIDKCFWWIPLKRLINAIELGQEFACDQSVEKYKIDSIELASGIVKVAKFSVATSPALFGAQLYREKLLKKRIQTLLNGSNKFKRGFAWRTLEMLSAIIAIAILFGRFWIV